MVGSVGLRWSVVEIIGWRERESGEERECEGREKNIKIIYKKLQ